MSAKPRRTSVWLMNEPALQVMPSVACALGVDEAIFLQQVQFWLRTSKHEYEERMWIYNTLPQWLEQMPFFSRRTLQRIIAGLQEHGILLVTHKFNASPTDRTNWYAIDFERFDEFMEAWHVSTDENGVRQNGALDSAKMAHSIAPKWRTQDSAKMAHSIIRNTEKITTEETTNREGDASASPAPEPYPDTDSPSEPKAQKKGREEHPAVALYRSLCAKQLNDVQVKMLEETNPPLDILKQAITEWKAAGNRPTNVKGVLDWVAEPWRMGKKGPAKAGASQAGDIAPIEDEVELEAMRKWARETYPHRFPEKE